MKIKINTNKNKMTIKSLTKKELAPWIRWCEIKQYKYEIN